MSQPSTADFLAAAEAAYGDDPAGTSGLSLLTGRNGAPVAVTRAADGFHGVAFETGAGQVIVAFEGTDIGDAETRPTFVAAQVKADGQIAAGQDPALYADALTFAHRAVAVAGRQGVSSDDVFVDGHSLGGAAAEYVAVKTGLGGVTFGAPGIPAADINTGLPSRLTNYVDDGDPVGNYSDNPNRIGHLLMGSGIERYGRATYVGSPSDARPLAVAGRLYGTSDLGSAVATGIVVDAIVDHHLLGHYAADLGQTLPGSGNGSDLTAADVESALSTISGVGAGGVGSQIGTGIGGLLGGHGIGGILGGLGLGQALGGDAHDAVLGAAARHTGPAA